MEGLQFANAVLTRLLWVVLLILVLVWIDKMGGYDTGPENTGFNSNDTSRLFNWHPLLMVIAFPVFMTEAILIYSQPFPESRDTKKIIHGCLHVATAICLSFGLVAVFRSHSQHEPSSIDDLYSPHSYLGITTLVLFSLQFIFGAVAYVLDLLDDSNKRRYTEIHHFIGMATFLTALATMMAGLQEKSTFNLNGGLHFNPPGHFGTISKIPAAMVVLLVILGISVSFHKTITKRD